MQTEWIRPFQGRNKSLSYDYNLLWRTGKLYLMDNHGAALWCWLRELDTTNAFKMFHIDAHWDCLGHNHQEWDEWMKALADFKPLALAEYLAVKDPNSSFPAIRWDTYLSIFLQQYGGNCEYLYGCTHGIGDCPLQLRRGEDFGVWDLPEMLEYEVNKEDDVQLIINLDLDFFCFSVDNPEHTQLTMFSEAYLEHVFRTIATALEKDRVKVITVSLSPECCGGWEQSEALGRRLFERLRVKWPLPVSPEIW